MPDPVAPIEPAPPLARYADLLRRFDWSYEYSDDHSVWRRGAAEEKKLIHWAKTSPTYQRLYDLAQGWYLRQKSDTPPVLHEKGWRWAGAYCWVHGYHLSFHEAQELVDSYGNPDWRLILARCARAGAQIRARINGVLATLSNRQMPF